MKTINKIILVQFAFIIGDIIVVNFMDTSVCGAIYNHIIITMGYFYGFWHSKQNI